jgi:hypothetical protein
MGASYDAINDRAVLAGDGLGYARVKKALPVAPTGADQVIYIIRGWLGDDTTSGGFSYTDAGLSTSPTLHWGMSFNSAHPSKDITTAGLTAHEAAYSDFFGVGQYMSSVVGADSAGWHFDNYNTTSDDFYAPVCPASTGVVQQDAAFTDGNGSSITTLDHTVIPTYSQGALMVNKGLPGEYLGSAGKITICWRVRRMSASTEEIQAELWCNLSAIDLDAFDLETDLDPQSPLTSITNTPSPGSFDYTATVNSTVATGTNWMPTSQTMAFPTYFMAAHPMTTGNFEIDYVGVRYDSLYT